MIKKISIFPTVKPHITKTSKQESKLRTTQLGQLQSIKNIQKKKKKNRNKNASK